LFSLFEEACAQSPNHLILTFARSVKGALLGPSTAWRTKARTQTVSGGSSSSQPRSISSPASNRDDKTTDLFVFLIKNYAEMFKDRPSPDQSVVPPALSEYNVKTLEKKLDTCRSLLMDAVNAVKSQKKQELVEFEANLQSLVIFVNKMAKAPIAKANEIIDTEALDAFSFGLTELKQLLSPQKGLFERTLKTTRLKGLLDKKNSDLSALTVNFTRCGKLSLEVRIED